MEDKRENERLAIVETRLDSLIEGNMRIEKKLDFFSSNYITRKETDMMFETQDRQITEIKKRQETNDSNKRANLSLILVGFTFIVMLVFNILNYFK